LHDDDAILEADDDRNHPKDGGEDARQLVLARLLLRSGERVDAELEVDAAKGVERAGPDVAEDDSGRAEAEGEEFLGSNNVSLLKVLIGVLGEQIIILVIALEEGELAIHKHEENNAAGKDIDWWALISSTR